jgi:hypothetical protein
LFVCVVIHLQYEQFGQGICCLRLRSKTIV